MFLPLTGTAEKRSNVSLVPGSGYGNGASGDSSARRGGKTSGVARSLLAQHLLNDQRPVEAVELVVADEEHRLPAAEVGQR